MATEPANCCCPENHWPALTASFDGLKGKTVEHNKMHIYAVGEPTSTPVVLITDLFGSESGRAKQVCWCTVARA